MVLPTHSPAAGAAASASASASFLSVTTMESSSPSSLTTSNFVAVSSPPFEWKETTTTTTTKTTKIGLDGKDFHQHRSAPEITKTGMTTTSFPSENATYDDSTKSTTSNGGTTITPLSTDSLLVARKPARFSPPNSIQIMTANANTTATSNGHHHTTNDSSPSTTTTNTSLSLNNSSLMVNSSAAQWMSSSNLRTLREQEEEEEGELQWQQQQYREQPPRLPFFVAPVLLSFQPIDSSPSPWTTPPEAEPLMAADSASFWGNVMFLLLSDVIRSSIVQRIPQKLVERQLSRRRQQLLTEDLRSSLATASGWLQRSSNTTTSIKQSTIRGIPNFGQTCFLNSVLQALASLEPFLVYLQRTTINGAEEAATTFTTESELSVPLQACLESLNGGSNHHSLHHCVGTLLRRIAQSHAQFRKGSGEQQDAQELLQALMNLLIDQQQQLLQQQASDVHGSNASQRNNVWEESTNGLASSDHSLSSVLWRLYEQEQEEQERLQREKVEERHHQKHRTSNGEKPTPSEAANDDYNRVDYPSMVIDEKKQDDQYADNNKNDDDTATLFGDSSLLIVDDDSNGWTATSSSVCQNDKNMPLSLQIMLATLSPITPSPLNGWMGSTLQCCICHHVRPIPNAPFLDLPLVPTSLSDYLSGRESTAPTKQNRSLTFSSCSLQQCLREFTRVERVTDVECLACTRQAQLDHWQEEVDMLRGACNTLLQKKQTKDPAMNVDGLQQELTRAQWRVEMLQQIDPDDSESLTSLLSQDNKNDDELLMGDETNGVILRQPAFKRLLLTRLPTVLCFHIQRRFFDPVSQTMSKTTQHVNFPNVLDMGEFCAYSCNGDEESWMGKGSSKTTTTTTKPSNQFYRLQSVIEHCGNAYAGHYQTYRKKQRNNKDGEDEWFLVSDMSVQPVSWHRVRQCQAYMLFYEAM